MKKTQTQTFQIYKPRKEILYDTDHDKYYLKYSNDTKLYNSNLFGIKIPQTFNNLILGSYKDRILSHSMDKINFNVDNSIYRPQSNKFEGYAQFARPLVIPFTNETHPKTIKYLNDTKDKVENGFLTPKNKTIFKHKLNQGLDFYYGKINNIADTKGKNLFLKEINECLFNEKRREII